MAVTDVKLDDKTELTLPANQNDFIYILRQVAGGGFTITDYKIKVRNLVGDALIYSSDGVVDNPVGGTIYFNETTNELRGYDGTAFFDMLNRIVKVTITAAQINALGTTPVDVIQSPGAGKYIKLLTVDSFLNWGSVAFDNNSISLTTETAANAQHGASSVLNQTSDVFRSIASTSATGTNIVEDKKVQITGTDSVAVGDSTMDFYIAYKIINI